MFKKSSVVVLFCSSLSLYSDIGAIIGGDIQKNGIPYAGFVDADLNVTRINTSNLKTKGDVYSVMINANKYTICGGAINTDTTPFAWVASRGLEPGFLNLPFAGAIYSVAMNDQRFAIIGGNKLDLQYAAIINKDLKVLPLENLPQGVISSVATNAFNFSLAGGANETNTPSQQSAYLIEETGAYAALTNLYGDGEILSVDLNNQREGVIGGYSIIGAMNQPYLARISNGQTAVQPVDFSMFPEGEILSVGINAHNQSLAGGFLNDPQNQEPFAGWVDENGSFNLLTGLPNQGSIQSVAINIHKQGLIGGEEGLSGNGLPFAALILPDQTIVKIGGLPIENGIIHSVAMTDTQVGIIGGQLFDSKAPYAAIISPNGTLKGLKNLPKNGAILDVDINDLNPESIGPFATPQNILFAASNTLTNAKVLKKKAWNIKSTVMAGEEETALVASGNQDYAKFQRARQKNQESIYQIWGSTFYNYIRQNKPNKSYNYKDDIGGLVVGFDANPTSGLIVGLAGAYGFSAINYENRAGHGKVNQGLLSVYGCYEWEWIYLNGALWTGGYSLTNKRNTNILNQTIATSVGNTEGWLVSPHLEISCAPYKGKIWQWFVLEGFLSADWANNWQKGFTEKNGDGFNLVIPKIYDSILYAEGGIRCYEFFDYKWGKIFIAEKFSYANLTPFGFDAKQTSFAGGLTPFPIKIGVHQPQNLFCLQLNVAAIPNNPKIPIISFNYQQSNGSSFESYYVGFDIGGRF